MSKDFNPGIFLAIAKRLLDIEDLDEKGRFRTSIGRAYYSAFLLTRTRLERKGKRFGTDAQHKEVREFLKTIHMDYMADLLNTLFESRRDADYYLSDSKNKSINKSLCDKCIGIAEAIIEKVEEISIS